jgi:hypothetical protein
MDAGFKIKFRYLNKKPNEKQKKNETVPMFLEFNGISFQGCGT